jgi:hypothetical protein
VPPSDGEGDAVTYEARRQAAGRACILLSGLLLSAGLILPASPPQPAGAGVVRFAVLGDNGTGQKAQYEVGAQMSVARADFPFTFVIMVGDNLYGSQRREDFVSKFEQPYSALLHAGVTFHAALGNHDQSDNRFYAPFNMGGQRYYTFVKDFVRFVVLDTNLMDSPQLDWFEDTLRASREAWTICVFHHPLYSDGERHGPSVEMRVLLEPLLVRYDVDVVFAGHEHFYERIKPQKGVTHFIAGSGGQLRKGDVTWSPITAAAFDQDRAFMLVEVGKDLLSFRAISRTGRVVDAGTIQPRLKN